MNNIVCPACGSDKVKFEKETITLSEPYGGEREVVLDNYACEECDFEGDILNLNDRIIVRELNKLKAAACRNIIEYFEEKGITVPALERILGLQMGTLADYKHLIVRPDPPTVALLKFLRRFPWLLDVAEAKFDLQKSQEIFMENACNDKN